jgi:hypothetical protein
MEVVRALLCSTLADDANFMAADITDYYLNTPLERPEYLRMTRKQVSSAIIAEYGYEESFVNDMMYFQVNKGMYDLPQAGLLAPNRLIAYIVQHGCTQSDVVPCLFRHATNGVTFDADDPTTENGMVHAISSIIDVVVASAGEAEYGSAFIFAQRGVWLRNVAITIGHAQPATPILCDNAFAIGLANDNIKQKRSKSIDMRFHWLRNRVKQGQFTITYLAGTLNLADFLTKTMPCAHHQAFMPCLVHTPLPKSAFFADGDWHLVTARRRQQLKRRIERVF